MVYQGGESSDNTIAEGDPFTLICKVNFMSEVINGTWHPELILYDHNNRELSLRENKTVTQNLVRIDVVINATIDMKRFRCHVLYSDPPPGAVKSNTSSHFYASNPPSYTSDSYIPVTVQCEIIILFTITSRPNFVFVSGSYIAVSQD